MRRTLLPFPTRRSSDLECDRANDPRAAPLVERLIGKQDERARWMLEKDLNAQLITRLEEAGKPSRWRSEEHTSELQSHVNLVCRLLLEKKKHLFRSKRG